MNHPLLPVHLDPHHAGRLGVADGVVALPHLLACELHRSTLLPHGVETDQVEQGEVEDGLHGMNQMRLSHLASL